MWSTVMQLPCSHIYPDGFFFVVFLKPTGKTSMDHGNPNQWDGSAGDSVGWAWDGCTTLGWWFALWDTQVPINQQTWPIPEVIPQSEWQPYLVGGIPTPLKNMRVSWDDDIPNIWENKKCSKPPTSTNQILFEFYVHIILQFSPVPCILTFLAVFGLKSVSVSTHAQKNRAKN